MAVLQDGPHDAAFAADFIVAQVQIPVGKPPSAEVDEMAGEEIEVGAAARKKACAWLLVKINDLDTILYPECGVMMVVIAVVRDPA